MSNFAQQFKAALRVSTPLVAVRTPDPASTIRNVIAALPAKKGEQPTTPVIHWDMIHGMAGLNTPGKSEIERILEGGKPEMKTARPTEALQKAEALGEYSVLFFANGQLFWKNEGVIQAIWNLRDQFKARGSMLVILTTLGAVLPAELSQDVLILDDPLPTVEELAILAKDVYKNAWNTQPKSADVEEPEAETLTNITNALVGLAPFPAEQTLSMCLTSKGLDAPELWERKRKTIEQVRGLTVWRGGEKFADLGGLSNAKSYFTRIMNGPKRPDGIVFTDEIEKIFAGFGTDSSGTTTKMVGSLLSYMEDKQVTGSLFFGPPGSGKSALAKALGNEAGIPTVQADFAAMETSLVGASGENVRAALSIIDAMFKNPLFIGTCNSWGSLPPELRRRYRLASFFYDFPTKEERAGIWQIYTKKYSLADQELPPDAGWTGAEIRNCCDTAYRLGCTLVDAACYVVPVSISARDTMTTLRQGANGKFVSASEPGLYQFREEAATPSTKRKFREIDADIMTGLGKS